MLSSSRFESYGCRIRALVGTRCFFFLSFLSLFRWDQEPPFPPGSGYRSHDFVGGYVRLKELSFSSVESISFPVLHIEPPSLIPSPWRLFRRLGLLEVKCRPFSLNGHRPTFITLLFLEDFPGSIRMLEKKVFCSV